jgi:hydroxyacylglutathione hydrolase
VSQSNEQMETKKGTIIHHVIGGRSNVFLISKKGCSILVDTSTANNYSRLVKCLDALSVAGQTLSALVLTHVHFDHAANAARIREACGARLIVPESEAALLEAGRNAPIGGAVSVTRFLYKHFNGAQILNRMTFEPSLWDIAVQGRRDLREFGLDAYIHPTPGHSAGSQSVVVDDEIAIVGDALFGVFRGSVLPPWAADAELMIKSWKILLDTGCRLFLPGHGRPRDRETLQNQYNKYSRRLK